LSNELSGSSLTPGNNPELLPPYPYSHRGDFRPEIRPRFQNRLWKHVLLFLLTVLTTTAVGGSYYYSYISNFGRQAVVLPTVWSYMAHGLWYSIPVLLILGAHEMGHYLLCRRYQVDASLPYFIPLPLPPTGTLGAVIRIREAFPTRTSLFDIGVAGPIAGFLMLIPVLIWGLVQSHIVTIPRLVGGGLEFGEPLLVKGLSYLILGRIPDGYLLNAHPMVFAGLLGMFATALNLLPFGQLDGGHITYATLRRHSTWISAATVLFAFGMCFVATTWRATTMIMIVMLFAFGPQHPQVVDEDEPLGPYRRAVAIFALIMLVLCFTPIPIEQLDVLGRRF
jgi:membrane-associated protease RseP (regulator of RpoE activity)